MSLERREQNVPELPLPWPSDVTADNRVAISRHLATGRGLAASVALAITEEVGVLMKRESDIYWNLPVEVAARDMMSGRNLRDWTSYKRVAHAVLNAEYILETGKPYEEPGTDFEAIERESRGSFFDFMLDKGARKEVERKRRAAGEIVWFTRELSFAKQYKATDSPLEFVDTVVSQEIMRMHNQDVQDQQRVERGIELIQQLNREEDEIDIESQDTSKDEAAEALISAVRDEKTKKRMDAMERGRLRFHQLYQEFNH